MNGNGQIVAKVAPELRSESTAEVWKRVLADYDGRRFVSWPAAEEEIGDLFRGRARELPPGVTAQNLFDVARRAGWLKEEGEGMVVLRIPADWWETQVTTTRPRRKSSLSE